MAAPTAVAVHDQENRTITYTFSAPVKLVSETGKPDLSMAEILPTTVQIYSVTAGPTWAPPSVAGITIDEAYFTGNVMTLKYDGILLEGDYLADTWGYNVCNLDDEEITHNTDLIFSAVDALDSSGDIFVDFVWGNLPMQPDDERGANPLNSAQDSHEIATGHWNGYPGYIPNTRGDL